MPTGIENGFFVVEADTLEGHNVDGITNLQALIDANGAWPDTRRHRSSTGSIHHLFKNPPGVRIKGSTSELAPGVDVLGEGNMVLTPPSINPGVGQYVCLNPETPIADPTEWLLALVTADADEGDHEPNEDLIADDQEEIIFAFDAIRNDDLNRSDWHDRGMAIFAATGGSKEGFEAFQRFSTKSKKYMSKRTRQTPKGATVERWGHWRKYPPTRGGAGSIKHWADEDCPGWREAYDAEQDRQLDQIKLASLAVDQAALDALLNKNAAPGAVVNGLASLIDALPKGNKIEVGKIAPPAPTPATATPKAKTNGAAGGTWFNPVDLWDKFDPPELPTGLLPEAIEKYARVAGATMGADPAGFAMAALTVCAAAISDRIKLQPKKFDEHWLESARIWTLLIGDPSSKKSPTLRQAAWPLAHIDADLVRAYLEQKVVYDDMTPEERRATQPPTLPPKQPRIKIEDTTIEAAQEVLKDSPDGVLCLQDELSGWFSGMDKYSGSRGAGKDRAFWLQSFNGGPYSFHRIGRGSGLIPNLSVSILGGIQPEPMRRLASGTMDDGLLQRGFPIMLRTATIGQDEPADPVVSKYGWLVKDLHRLQPPQRQQFNEANPTLDHVLRFSEGAQAIRNQLEIKHSDLMKCEALHPKLIAHVGKYDGLFARLCVIWHCIENVSEAVLPDIITDDTAQHVAAFLHDFLFRHAISFYTGVLGLSDDHERLAAVAGYILARGLKEVNNRDIQRSARSLRKLTDQDTLKIFEQLEAFGWIERELPKRRGPQRICWVVNAEVHKLFKERAEQEASRRLDTREAILAAMQAAKG